MINAVEIENYKSIQKLKLKLGRVNLFIGENGCGKSNILEAIALASAASANKLDSEFLLNRGIRLSSAELMRSKFDPDVSDTPIKISIYPDIKLEINDLNNLKQVYSIKPDGSTYINWNVESKKLLDSGEDLDVAFDTISKGVNNIEYAGSHLDKFKNYLNGLSKEAFKELQEGAKKEIPDNAFSKFNEVEDLFKYIHETIERGKEILPKANEFLEVAEDINQEFDKKTNEVKKFLIYSPENSSLRRFYKEGQIEPLGINGEGLLKLIKVISDTDHNGLLDIINALKLFGWFEEFKIPDEFSSDKDTLKIKDRFINSYIDQRIANEGFLFVLFYMSLIVSKDTPNFFAIDNIDASLNPALCTKLMSVIVELSEKYNKQILLTTHNPAILDGINILDRNQRLNVVSRDDETGETKVRVITPKRKPKSSTKEELKMSEAMLRGYFGGLPEGF